MPGMTALHGNKIKENMFWPDEGRIDAPTEETNSSMRKKIVKHMPSFAYSFYQSVGNAETKEEYIQLQRTQAITFF